MHSIISAPDRKSVGLPLLCSLLTLLFFAGFRTCVPAQFLTTSLPAVSPSVPLPESPNGKPLRDAGITLIALSRCPEGVQKVVRHLRSVRFLNPLRGYKGGKTFHNDLKKLPDGIRYLEYDVLPYV